MKRPACASEKTRISPVLTVCEATGPATQVIVRVSEQTPGLEYTFEGEARDTSSNAASFIATFYGFNPNIPRLVLNEFITQGTTDHPDMVELKVTAGGDMGGVVLYQGTPGSFDDRLVFPSWRVTTGEFIARAFQAQRRRHRNKRDRGQGGIGGDRRLPDCI